MDGGPVRNCLRCGREITACFGGVLVRDQLAAEDGKIAYSQVREHCGHCVLELDLKGETQEYLRSIPDLVPGYT